MKYSVIICLLFVFSLSLSSAHGVYYNSYNDDFDDYSKITIKSLHRDSGRLEYKNRYSDILGNEFNSDSGRKVVWDSNSEYYLRYSRTFQKQEAIRCHSSAPVDSLFYVKC